MLVPGPLGALLGQEPEVVPSLTQVMPAALKDAFGGGELVSMSMSQDSARIFERSGPALAPSPTRLIASMPHAMPMSIVPAAINPAMVRWALPHWQSTVVAPTCFGQPVVSQPTRVTCY